jgi:pyruvate dehydrogenase E2 component (dihydrolipoamide acetyltransferase)
MATEITMPQLSDTMDNGTILNWFKKEGDKVKRGDALAEVSTDKADLEIESFYEGTLLKIHAPVGTKVQVGSLIAVIGAEGESVSTTTSSSKPAPVATALVIESAPAPEAPAPQQQVQKIEPVSTSTNGVSSGDRVKISPLAKNIAKSHGVDISNLSGTGDGGRIVRKDIEKLISSAGQLQTQTATTRSSVTTTSTTVVAGTQPLSKMRSTIATRMAEAKSTIPHFYVTSRIVVDRLVEARASLKVLPQYEGITFNHMVIKATALALKAFPRINANYQDGQLVQPGEVNIGIITALDDGLLIPIVKNADQLSLADIVSTSRELINRARAGKPKPADLMGGTFCISNIGTYAVEDFTAIINPGQGGILAVGNIADEAVVVDGQVKPGKVMRITLSVDHRIIDGVVAGQFVTELKRLIEDPVLLLA